MPQRTPACGRDLDWHLYFCVVLQNRCANRPGMRFHLFSSGNWQAKIKCANGAIRSPGTILQKYSPNQCAVLNGRRIAERNCSVRLRCRRKRKSIQNVLHGKDQVLAPIELVSHWRRIQLAAHIQVPECFARGWLERQQIARVICAE
jgi:hypothetical protein